MNARTRVAGMTIAFFLLSLIALTSPGSTVNTAGIVLAEPTETTPVAELETLPCPQRIDDRWSLAETPKRIQDNSGINRITCRWFSGDTPGPYLELDWVDEASHTSSHEYFCRSAGTAPESGAGLRYLYSSKLPAFVKFDLRGASEAGLTKLASQSLASAEKRAAPCSTTPPTPTETSADQSCAFEGRVTDVAGKPLTRIKVSVATSFSATDRVNPIKPIVSTATDTEGRYKIAPIDLAKLPSGFDINRDTLIVAVQTIEWNPESHTGRFFSLLVRQVFPTITTKEFAPKGKVCTHNFPLDGGAHNFGHQNFAGANFEWWKNYGSLYRQARASMRLAAALNLTPDYGKPLRIYSFCDDIPRLKCQSSNSVGTFAFYMGSGTAETGGIATVNKPYLVLDDSASARINDQPLDVLGHELGHALLADAFDNSFPFVQGQKNHAGYYANTSSADAWTEGFATFWAAMVNREINERSRPELWRNTFGWTQNLEYDQRVWDNDPQSEEIAVAGLLYDLTDSDRDYRDGRVDDELSGDTRLRWTESGSGDNRLITGFLIDPPAGSDHAIVAEFLNSRGKIAHRLQAASAASVARMDGEIDATGSFVMPVPTGWKFERVRVRVMRGGIGGGDDDAVSIPLTELWNTLMTAQDSSTANPGQLRAPGYRYPFDMSDVYGRLLAAHQSDTETMGNINRIFIKHGFFGDTNGNRSFQSGEKIGETSHPARSDGSLNSAPMLPRFSSPISAQLFATIKRREHGGQESVYVVYPGQRHDLSYSYTAAADAKGRIPLAMPPADSGAQVMVVASAEGHLPKTIATIKASKFWADAAQHDGKAFLAIDAKLQRGEIEIAGSGDVVVADKNNVWGITAIGLGAILLLASILALYRLRK